MINFKTKIALQDHICQALAMFCSIMVVFGLAKWLGIYSADATDNYASWYANILIIPLGVLVGTLLHRRFYPGIMKYNLCDIFDYTTFMMLAFALCLWGIAYIGFMLADDRETALKIVKSLPQACLYIWMINFMRIISCKK